MLSVRRHLFQITRAWVQCRDATLRAEEDDLIREARERATGEDRLYLDALLDLRRKNARREKLS